MRMRTNKLRVSHAYAYVAVARHGKKWTWKCAERWNNEAVDGDGDGMNELQWTLTLM